MGGTLGRDNERKNDMSEGEEQRLGRIRKGICETTGKMKIRGWQED